MTRYTSAWVAGLLVLGGTTAQGAQPSADVARATKLARQAATLEQRGDLTAAYDALAQAARLDPEAAILVALAKIQRKLGQLVEARETLTPVVFGATEPRSGAQTEGKQLFSDLSSSIPRVHVVIDARPVISVLTLTVDGGVLPPGAERLPLPIDPGHHVLVANAPDLGSQTVEFDAAEGKQQTIVVHLSRAAPVPVMASPPPTPPPPPPVLPPRTPDPAVGLIPSGAPVTDRDDRRAAARRARFSVGRYFLESLGSAVVGSLAAYGTFKATCGDQPCLGGSLASLGVNVVVTPVTVWGLGEATGGNGSLGWTFAGGLAAFSGYAAGTSDPTLPLVVGVILMPFTSALLYEVSSGANAQRMLGPGAALTPSFAPLMGPTQTPVGAMGGVSGRF